MRNFEVIGEAVKRISAETKAMRPEQPWNEIARMRDKLIHHYSEVDLDVLWRTAKISLPQFRNAVAELLIEASADGS